MAFPSLLSIIHPKVGRAAFLCLSMFVSPALEWGSWKTAHLRKEALLKSDILNFIKNSDFHDLNAIDVAH